MTEVLGRYRIDEVLSRGGSATTYKAHQAHLDRSVLLKVLHPSLTKDERSVERFSREARAVAKIRHPGIVHIYDYGKADEFYYIAMEFVEGLSLAELLDRDKRMPVDVATYVAYQCSKSLAYAHSKGVVHRDIKPGNIILAYNGGVKITDFGLAYSKDLTSITIDGELFGTPSYMSPEQIRGEKIDERTDIYSLGLTFYQMVSGVKCFEGDNYPAIITKKLTEDVVPLRKIVTDCPQRLANIVSKAVERNAARRYQSMDDLSHDLEGFAKDCGFVLDERAVADYLGGKSEGTLLQVAPV
ncbi:MAG: serine/threonine protein kinase, partial [bacterium]